MQPAETVPKSRNSLIFPLNSRKLWHHFHLPLTHWHHSSQLPWAKDLNRNYFLRRQDKSVWHYDADKNFKNLNQEKYGACDASQFMCLLSQCCHLLTERPPDCLLQGCKLTVQQIPPTPPPDKTNLLPPLTLCLPQREMSPSDWVGSVLNPGWIE